MKPNREAHLDLRRRFNDSMHTTRTARDVARRLIHDGRLTRISARAVTPPITADIEYGLSLSAEGAAIRRSAEGDRELCLALAFCNNTLYGDAERKHTSAPSGLRLASLLARCFPLDEVFPRSEMTRAWSTIIKHWFAGQAPRAILQALVTSHPAEAPASAP